MDIEKRCIEFIPAEERYGTPRRMFTMWFSSNLQVTTLVVGLMKKSSSSNSLFPSLWFM